MKRDFEELDDIQQKIQTIPEELPILPVRDAVIFPNAVIPLTVGRESSVKLINDVQQGDGMLVVLTQRDKHVDSPAPADLYDIGTVSMVHRVMKTNAPFVFSLPHPAYDVIDDDADPPVVRRSYFDTAPVTNEDGSVDYPRTTSEVITGLVRANFRVDWLLEPEPASGGHRSGFWRETFATVPRTLVIRARKEGI